MTLLARHFLAMAENNGCANRRLLDACLSLTDEDFAAPRTGFFPSLMLTLNHILLIDRYYIAGLHGEATSYAMFDDDAPYRSVQSLRQAQAVSDRRLVDFCAGLAEDDLSREVHLTREDRVDVERVDAVLPHLFQHQIHHRGQAHAMLSGTPVAPPQLDEFFLELDAEARRSEVEAFYRATAAR